MIYTHGFAGLAGGLLVGIFADPNMALFYKTTKHGLVPGGAVAGVIHGNWTLLKWQFFAALFVIAWTGVVTFILLKLVGLFIPLRMSTENMEIGDVAEHGHEVYPSDVPSLGFPVVCRSRCLARSGALQPSSAGAQRPGEAWGPPRAVGLFGSASRGRSRRSGQPAGAPYLPTGVARPIALLPTGNPAFRHATANT